MSRNGGSFELRDKRVWVAGHRGMVGSALVRRLQCEGCDVLTAGRDQVDLRDQAATRDWLDETRPDAIFFADCMCSRDRGLTLPARASRSIFSKSS